MSNFELDLETQTGEWTLERDDAATLWYALDVYKVSLQQKVSRVSSPEDEYFLYTLLRRVAELQFDLRDNHEGDMADKVRSWLDTE